MKIDIKLDSNEILKKYNSIAKNLKELSSKKVVVKFDEEVEYPSGEKVETIAVYMEYGSDEFQVNYPARPFWRTSLKLYEPQIRRRFEHNLEQVANGKMTANQCYEDLGKQMREYIKKTIYSGNFKPLADSTLKARERKGTGSTPLLDTQLLINSIVYEVV